LIEDDAELVDEKVKDHVGESWDDVEKQEKEIIRILTKVKGTLVQL
jgi:hypothetical protein